MEDPPASPARPARPVFLIGNTLKGIETPSHAFLRNEVQNVFDEAHREAGVVYGDTLYLQEYLQWLYREAFDRCNQEDVDPVVELHKTIWTERLTLDAFNKHRLGNAVTERNQRPIDPKNVVEYNEEENIPELLEFFPLRAALAKRGCEVDAPPIFQLEGTVTEGHLGTAKVPLAPKEPIKSSVTSSIKAPTQPVAVPKKAIPKKAIPTRAIPTKAAPTKAVPTKATGSTATYNKLRDAPSAWLAFPAGNLTFAEIMAFLPQSIKSVDMINRLLFNGAMTTTITDMINQYRDMNDGAINNNSVYRMMKGPIDHYAKQDLAYRNWTVAKHSQILLPLTFDATSVSVRGFGTPVNNNSREVQQALSQPPPSIHFRDLANGVKVRPSGYDALDLTRCVEYCENNPDEDWQYPQQFVELVNHLGGPAPVHPNHQDDASIRRHTRGNKLINARLAGARARDNHGRLVKQGSESVVGQDDSDSDDVVPPTKKGEKRKRNLDGHSSNADDNPGSSDDGAVPSVQPPKKKKKPLPKPRVPRAKKPAPSTVPVEMDSDEDSDVYVGPKRKKRATIATRASSRPKRYEGSYNVNQALQVDEEEEESEGDSDEDLYD